MNMKAIFAVVNTTTAAVKTMPEKYLGLYRIWTHDLHNSDAELYQPS